MRGIAVRAEYAAFMGECERLGVSVGGNAENKYMVFRRILVRDDAALRGGDGLGGEGGMVDLRYGADVALASQSNVRSERDSLTFTTPQSEHVLLDGYHLSTTRNAAPVRAVLYSSWRRNSPKAASDRLRAR